MRYHISPPPVSPVGRILAALASIVILAGALAFGFVVLLVALGFAAAFGLYVWIRTRFASPAGPRDGARGPFVRVRPERSTDARRASSPDGQDIDGEYTVVSRRRE